MNYSVNLSSGQTVEVVIGEAAQINVEQALNYIESGRVEITNYVNEWAKPEITNYTNEYAKPIVTEIVNQTTKPLIDDYLNTTTKPQIDEYVADNVKPYADSAQDSAAKAKISKDNAKTSETNAKASELAAASSAGVASAAAVTATEAKDYTEKVLTDENLKTVGQDLQSADSNIKTVATNIVNVNTVAKNIDNVNLLAPHTEAMEALAPDIMDVVTVAGISEQTKNVSDNMAHVVAVDNNKANIDKAVTNEANIITVATDMNTVKTVANNIEIIDNVAWNKSNINNVSVNMPFVKGVSDNIEHVVAVDRNKANIDTVASNKTNINNVSVNMPAVKDVSENMADVKKAVQSANDAKLWAVGTKTEKPEGSSKYWAEQAQQAAQVYDATETVKGIVRLATSEEVTAGTNNSAAITPLKLKPKLDLKQDKSTAVNYDNISNCITYIPQDIKLELNNGTLTLKAGSKLYIPNSFETSTEPLYAWTVNGNNSEVYYTESETPAVGDKTYNENGTYTGYKVNEVSGTTLVLQKGSGSVVEQVTVTRDTSKDTYFSKPDTTKPKFDEVVIENDLTYTPKENRQTLVCYDIVTKKLWANWLTSCKSGNNPSGFTYGYYYNTTTNKLNDYRTTIGDSVSLPIAIVTDNGSIVTSIDQVFNGFGYIGSTIYALPGVKGLIPNGRNTDGSLKNIEFTLDKVSTFTRDWNVINQFNQHIRLGLNIIFASNGYIESVNMPTVNNYIMWYNPRDNIMRYNDTDNSVTSIADYPIVEMIELGGTGAGDGTSRITSFVPKTVFHALDYNDKSIISGWSMPSSRYIDLTLAASGSTYTAPANGYFYLVKVAGKDTGDIRFTNKTKNIVQEVLPKSSTYWLYIRMEAQKGDVFEIVYYATGETKKFRFIFAEGDK